MRYLGLDLGTRTLGIAISDKLNIIATSLETIRFEESNYDVLQEKLKEIIEKYNITTLVLGLPKNMNNSLGDRALTTISFKEKLESWFNIEIVLEDERLTTIQAYTYMHDNNYSIKSKKDKKDSISACIILQTYLDKERKD